MCLYFSLLSNKSLYIYQKSCMCKLFSEPQIFSCFEQLMVKVLTEIYTCDTNQKEDHFVINT